MSKLLMLKGLPASGKSTYAKNLVKNKDYVRVNKDELRAMLHEGKHTKGNELEVVTIRDFVVGGAIGYYQRNVVVDDTNLNPQHEATLRQLAKKHGATFEVKFFDVSPEECIKRDEARLNSVGAKVIWDMYNNFLKKDEPAPEKAEIIDGLPWAVICDIDGTIADMRVRREKYGKAAPYQWHEVGTDDVKDEVVDALRRLAASPNTDVNDEDYNKDKIQVIMLSGRDGICRPQTEQWLKEHGIDYDHLFMRDVDNNEQDAIIKRRIYDENIKGKFNIKVVLDDRTQVVKMWRSLGLTCFQVAPGDF